MSKEDIDKMLEMWKRDNNYLSKIAKEIVFNADQPIQNRYTGLMIILDDARNKKSKIEHGIRRMEGYLNTLCEISLKEHKKRKVLEFTERWAGKDVNDQMVVEMQALEKPNHCYTFSGITVIEMDCNMCKSRKCQSSDKDYVPNQFEDLLAGYTDPMPEGTHSIDVSNQETESEVDDGSD